jgi:hypothetical protein
VEVGLTSEKRAHGRKVLSALGVAAAAVIAVNANVLAARWYERWDLTREGIYTLSTATKNILRGLDESIGVTVLLARTDPLLPPVRQMLVSYGAETQKLIVRYVDPEVSPAELIAVQQKYGILAGKADDGRVVTDAVVIVSRGERVWFLTADELGMLGDDGRARPRLEQALTEGIANVIAGEKAKVCFASGHGEASLDDVGPEGLAELRRRLDKSNYESAPIDLTRPDADRALSGCRLLAIVGPAVPYAADAAERVGRYVLTGGSLLLLLGPQFGEDRRVVASGLERVTEAFGVRIEPTIVLETDPGLRLPRGAGEVFLANPVEHPVTLGLVLPGGKPELKVVLSQSRSFALESSGPAKPLVKSSAQAVALADVRSVLEGAGLPPDARGAERIVAAAAELPKPEGSKEKYGPRLVAIGTAGPALGHSFRDQALIGDRLLVENAISWSAARPAIVSIPEKAERTVALALTEESLGEVLRYVLVYMPGAAAVIGLSIFLRRRAHEKRSRRAAARGAT